MELYKLSGFIEILKETRKILKSKNGKLITKTTFIYIILISVATISYINLTSFLQHDLLVKETFLILNSPTPPSFTELYAAIKNDIVLMLVVGLLLNIFSVFLSIFSMTSTILVSAATYSSETTILSFKELMVKVKASIKRPIITILYTYLFLMGFFFIAFCFLGSLAFLIENRSVLLTSAVVVGILAWILWLYLSVVFQLALAVSVIEEGFCGIQAIAKAGRLVKGKRMDGFLLNIVVATANVFVLIPYMNMNTSANQSMVHKMISAVSVATLSGLFAMYYQTAYTVLYFQCKEINGELETGLTGVYEYVKLPSADQDLP